MNQTEKQHQARVQRVLAQYAEERSRLDFIESHPSLVTWAIGRLGANGSWGWIDANHVWRPEKSLRDAIDACKQNLTP